MGPLMTILLATGVVVFNLSVISLVFYIALPSVVEILTSRSIQVSLYQSFTMALLVLAIKGHLLFHINTTSEQR
jgi:hypothetical protein